jgi:hypothetical protein
MIPDGHLLEQAWLAVVTHLWQTTLVLVPLFLLARALRNAPARLVNLLWTLGLVKVFLPLGVLEPLARKMVVPLMHWIAPASTGAYAWVGRACAVLDPVVFSVHAGIRMQDLSLEKPHRRGLMSG